MASKSKKRRRVLGASCILAALIIAGSSFAWFTSKDEVTNRLSASANYGVSIAENFQPPENWIPGQTINKDVGVVNTGNVDAFVRTWLTGEMKVLNTTALGLNESAVAKYSTGGFNNKTATATTDEELKALNLTKYTTGATNANQNFYYKELSTAQTTNPQENGENNQADGYDYKGSRGASASNAWTPNSSAYSEVQSMQAGGYLVFAPASAEYEYVTNQETELKVYLQDAANSNAIVEQTVTVPGGTLVKVTTATDKSSGTLAADGSVTFDTDNDTAVRGGSTDKVNTVYVKSAATFKPVNVDTETFAPVTEGTYLFARNVDQKLDTDVGVVMTAASLDDYEFSGYYFDALDTPATTTAGKGHYWALKNADARGTNRSDYTLPKNYSVQIGTAAATDKLDTGYGDDYKTKVLNIVFDNSGNLTSVTPTADLELYTAAYKQIENGALTWTYDSTNNVLSAIYQGGTESELATTDTTAAQKAAKIRDDIVVDIKLANVVADSTDDSWFLASKGDSTKLYYAYNDIDSNGTYKSTANPAEQIANRLWTFYYTNDVEEGDTTAKLVDSVTLRSTTQKDAFIAFDFDLNVNMESAQITIDESGNERTTPVETTGIWADATSDTTKTGANATKQETGEISSIVWTAVT